MVATTRNRLVNMIALFLTIFVLVGLLLFHFYTYHTLSDIVALALAIVAIIGIYYVAQAVPSGTKTVLSAKQSWRWIQQTVEGKRFFINGMLLIAFTFLVYGVVQAKRLEWILNPDALGYLEIARRYAAGDFVVRGYWSPMISWLTAIVTSIGITPELAIRYLIVISGLVSTVLSVVLAGQFGLRRIFRLVIAGFVAILLSSITSITADIIGVAFLLGYLCIIMSRNVVSQPIIFGLAAGIVAGLAYFARSYNLTFIVAHLLIYGGWLWVQKRSLKPVLRFVPSFVLLLAFVITPWIILLSERYGYFTFSTSAAHTRGLVAIGADRERSVTCIAGEVLCPFPSDILFPWEDHLPELQPNYNWSPFSSSENFQHQISLIAENIYYFLGINTVVSVLGILSLSALIMFRSKNKYRNGVAFLLLTAALYISGYMLTLSSGGVRYFIVPYIFILFAALLILQHVLETYSLSRAIMLVTTMGLLIGLASSSPMRFIVGTTLSIVRGDEQSDECALDDSTIIASDLIAPIASVGDNWRASMDIAYFTGVRSVGYLNPEKITLDEINRQLQQSNVNIVLIADNTPTGSNLLTQYGYTNIRQISYCGSSYTIFQVP
ncbi:MAG: hypothetical protein IAE80_07765 [Anaerolinea sp.]|nr:hypothetical protein [Anaerolinea sp.]